MTAMRPAGPGIDRRRFLTMDYRGQAIVLDNLAENLSAARKVV